MSSPDTVPGTREDVPLPLSLVSLLRGVLLETGPRPGDVGERPKREAVPVSDEVGRPIKGGFRSANGNKGRRLKNVPLRRVRFVRKFMAEQILTHVKGFFCL